MGSNTVVNIIGRNGYASTDPSISLPKDPNRKPTTDLKVSLELQNN